MKDVSSVLARFRPTTFKVNYAPGYKTFINHYIINDTQHPLHETRKRVHDERKRQGLWWHTTSNVELSKSGVVRNWCRKRLRNAFTEELRARGFDEHGKLVAVGALKGPWQTLGNVLQERKDFCLQGSLRFIVQEPLIAAKFADVRQETGAIIEAILEGVKAELVIAEPATNRAHTKRPIRNTLSMNRASQPRSASQIRQPSQWSSTSPNRPARPGPPSTKYEKTKLSRTMPSSTSRVARPSSAPEEHMRTILLHE